jgi:glycerol-3-phosphate acyltransferase PlsY
VMVVWKHRGNIQRLRAGTEPRFVKAAKAGAG